MKERVRYFGTPSDRRDQQFFLKFLMQRARKIELWQPQGSRLLCLGGHTIDEGLDC